MADTTRSEIRWPTLVALPILAAATYFRWFWVWGLLFVYWGVVAALRGEAYLVEPLYRGRDAVLFWIVTAAWIGLGTWSVVVDLFWRLP